MGLVCLPTWMVDFYGRCKPTYHRWVIRLVKVGFTKHISVVVSIICLLIFTLRELIQAEEKNSMFQLGRLSRLDNILNHCKLVLKSLMCV